MVKLCSTEPITAKEILECKDDFLPIKNFVLEERKTIPYPQWRKTPLPDQPATVASRKKNAAKSLRPNARSTRWSRSVHKSDNMNEEEQALEDEKNNDEKLKYLTTALNDAEEKRGKVGIGGEDDDDKQDDDGIEKLFEGDADEMDFQGIKDEMPFPKVKIRIKQQISMQVLVCDVIGLVPVQGAAGAGAMDIYCKVWYNDWLIGHTSETRCDYNVFEGEYGFAEWNEGEGEAFDFPMFHMYVTIRKMDAVADNARQAAKQMAARTRAIAMDANTVAERTKQAAEQANVARQRLGGAIDSVTEVAQTIVGRDADLFNAVRASFIAQGQNDYAELDVHPDLYGMWSSEFREHQWRKLPRMFADKGADDGALNHGGHLQFRISLMRRLVVQIVNLEGVDSIEGTDSMFRTQSYVVQILRGKKQLLLTNMSNGPLSSQFWLDQYTQLYHIPGSADFVDELDDLESARYLEATDRQKDTLAHMSAEELKKKKKEQALSQKQRRVEIAKKGKEAKAKQDAERKKALEGSSSSDDTSDDDDSDSDNTSSDEEGLEEDTTRGDAMSTIGDFIGSSARMKRRRQLKAMRKAQREFLVLKVFEMPFGCCAGSEYQAVKDKNLLGEVKLELNRDPFTKSVDRKETDADDEDDAPQELFKRYRLKGGTVEHDTKESGRGGVFLGLAINEGHFRDVTSKVPPAIVHEWADGPYPTITAKICNSMDQGHQTSKFLTMKEGDEDQKESKTYACYAFKQGHFVANWKKRWFFCIKPSRPGDPIIVDFYASEDSQITGGKKKGTFLVHSATIDRDLLDSPETKSKIMVTIVDKTGKKFKLRPLANQMAEKLCAFLNSVGTSDAIHSSSSDDDADGDAKDEKGKKPAPIKPARLLAGGLPGLGSQRGAKRIDDELEEFEDRKSESNKNQLQMFGKCAAPGGRRESIKKRSSGRKGGTLGKSGAKKGGGEEKPVSEIGSKLAKSKANARITI
jgi:hypothetical protein